MYPRPGPDSAQPRTVWARFKRRLRDIIRKGQSLGPGSDRVRPVRIRVPVKKSR